VTGTAKRLDGELSVVGVAVLVGTGAARMLALSVLVQHVGHDLEESGLHVLLNEGRGGRRTRGARHCSLDVGLVVALAGACGLLLASGLLALQLALGLGAHAGLLALPLALGLLADGGANWIRSDALGVALGRRTDGLALGARVLLAHILRATNAANGLLAVHSALGARSLLALHLAAGALANGVADGRADWVIALPSAFRVALSSQSNSGESQEEHDRQSHFWAEN